MRKHSKFGNIRIQKRNKAKDMQEMSRIRRNISMYSLTRAKKPSVQFYNAAYSCALIIVNDPLGIETDTIKAKKQNLFFSKSSKEELILIVDEWLIIMCNEKMGGETEKELGLHTHHASCVSG